MTRRLVSLLPTLACFALVVAVVKIASAAEVTRVVSAGDPDDPFDLELSLDWWHDETTARLVREVAGPAGTETQPDLFYRQVRNIVALRADFGLLPDVGLFASLPVVVSDDRQLDFSSGVDATSSSLLRDGILPGAGSSSYGLDADHNRPFEAPSSTVFRGPTRKGIAYLGAGINWAVLNQARNRSYPTWILTFEACFDVNGAQRFDPSRPAANTSVGLGYHQLIWSMGFSRRFGWLEPYVSGWYMLPVTYGSSPFETPGLGGNAMSRPQQRAGGAAGLEATVWERAGGEQRITLELRGVAELRLLGLAQSELWEPLSGASACSTNASVCRPGIDVDRDGDGKLDPNPGITRSPSYGILGGDFGISAQAGPHVRFRAIGGVWATLDHALTDARSNAPAYDLPGRRYRVEGGMTWHLLLDGVVAF